MQHSSITVPLEEPLAAKDPAAGSSLEAMVAMRKAQDGRAEVYRVVKANLNLPKGANDRKVIIDDGAHVHEAGFNNTTTVGQLKTAVNLRGRLHYKGKQLEDVKRVLSYEIQDNDRLTITPSDDYAPFAAASTSNHQPIWIRMEEAVSEHAPA
jgi:hypothetical protein